MDRRTREDRQSGKISPEMYSKAITRLSLKFCNVGLFFPSLWLSLKREKKARWFVILFRCFRSLCLFYHFFLPLFSKARMKNFGKCKNVWIFGIWRLPQALGSERQSERGLKNTPNETERVNIAKTNESKSSTRKTNYGKKLVYEDEGN